MPWTLKDIESLQQAGKVTKVVVLSGGRGAGKQLALKEWLASQPKPPGRIVTKPWKNKFHPQKEWIAEFLLGYANGKCSKLWQEYGFHPQRKWRFDWAIPDLMIAVEYEGLGFKKTGHTESARYSGNTDKYNAAAAMGWTVFRVTYLNYGTLPRTLKDFEQFKRISNGQQNLSDGKRPGENGLPVQKL